MPVVRIPLVGSLSSRDPDSFILLDKDQLFLNCIFQVGGNPVTGKRTVWVRARNKYEATAYPSAASGAGTAVMYWRGHSSPGEQHVLSAFGSTNSTIYDGTNSLGSITGQVVHMNETAISGVATVLFSCGNLGNRAYYYPEGGALTEITDSDFPPKQTSPLTITGNFAVMDGYTFIMCTNGQIWHSDLNSVSGWTSTSNITAQEYQDPGIGVMRHKNYIVAFSKFSTEFFVNNGNATGSVLGRVSHLASQIGCVNSYAITQQNDNIMWVGSSSGVCSVYIMDNSRIGKISTPEVDEYIKSTGTDVVRLNMLASRGRPYLALTNGTSIDAFVYDLDLKMWHRWTLDHAIRASDTVVEVNAGSFYVGNTSAKVIANTAKLATAEIQTSLIDMNTSSRKTLSRIRIIGDRAEASSNITIAWSDDDFQNFTTGRTIDMLSADPQMHRCGTFRRRSFKISGLSKSHTVSTYDFPIRLEALELEYSEAVK